MLSTTLQFEKVVALPSEPITESMSTVFSQPESKSPKKELPSAILLLNHTKLDRSTIHFQADEVQRSVEYKKLLFMIVVLSRYRKDVSLAAANAITILKTAEVSFSGMNLSRINIPGADLSSGIFDNSDLSFSNLAGVDFQNSYLNRAMLSFSDMSKTTFGKWPPILDHIGQVLKLSFSKDGKFLASLSTHDKSIFIWKITDFSLHGKILFESIPKLNIDADSVTSLQFSKDGKMLGVAAKQCCFIFSLINSTQPPTLFSCESNTLFVGFLNNGHTLISAEKKWKNYALEY